MSRQEALEEYSKALKQGQKEFRERQTKGLDPYPAVLDEILSDAPDNAVVEVGTVEIPSERIVGIRSAGRTAAFTAGFLPLLPSESEFALKWVNLCAAHLDEGIREPILCYEYLGYFYVQEGNKRVSVLKHFDAPQILSTVYRIMPTPSEEPRVKAYLEFTEFYKRTGLYTIQFTTPGGYAKLTAAAGIPAGEVWPEADRRRLKAYYQYFQEAFRSLNEDHPEVECEDALLLWLKLHPYTDLGQLSAAELKKSLAALWDNVVSSASAEPVVRTEPPEETRNLINIITAPNHVNVAFVHQRTPETSAWTGAHEAGRLHLEEALGRSVTTRAYFSANTHEQANEILAQAVAEGADVVFTTTPQLISASLKASIRYPRVRFLNCSVDMPYSSVPTYYSRIYEAKFITGAIAGAMSRDGRIGYVGSNPIHGVPASINAFALGAQMTNPDATIHLKWSCLPGNPTQEFLDAGIQVISNRDAYSTERRHHEYGTYMANDEHILVPLVTPHWVWGKFYENVIRSILSGSWDTEKSQQAVNHWWGMDSGVIDVEFSASLPEGIRVLGQLLRKGLQEGTMDPFLRKIVSQDGTVQNDGTQTFTPETLLHMDWLCENVVGDIPEFGQLLPFARPTVRLLGIHPDQIPPEEVDL